MILPLKLVFSAVGEVLPRHVRRASGRPTEHRVLRFSRRRRCPRHTVRNVRTDEAARIQPDLCQVRLFVFIQCDQI